ncbi:MAG: response regulator, partial [SAR324 cluster bacterium]|nr:response regulator [SAR324 cluster bacterium]
MDELILVLEENPEIQAVISASLKDSPVLINQELDPDNFLQHVQNLYPDLIFLSNSDSESNYRTCRKIREDPAIKNIPVILLVNAKDEINEDALRELKINGMLRKPFE